jgi:hypothetical protein
MAMVAMATPSKAQYLRALSELRTARDYIRYDQGGPYEHDRQFIADEITKAMDEIKNAAWDDGKVTQFVPPSHGAAAEWTPVHQALNLVDVAKGHLPPVDSPQTAELRGRIIHHIDLARNTLVHLSNLHVP